ncbi:MAG: sugar ABC transporter permease [Chloroflexota bacterium]|jgi:multiple sugar transport system permease protein|nr:sugar ABC transporter permease [Chloroflexota bacterium]
MKTAELSAGTQRRARLFGSNQQARSESLWAYLLIAPMMIGFSVFFLIALGASLVLTFTSWDMLTSPVWIGFANYTRLFGDAEFRTALWNTTAIAIPNVVFRLIVALALAMALNTNIRFRSFYRMLFFMPVLTMPVAIGTIWKWLYDPAFGPINGLLGSMGLPRPEWLLEPRTAIIAVVIVLLWSGVGYDMIIFLAGLQTIPRDYYDAAAIDGASAWQRFRDITVPLLTPTTFFLSVIGIIFSLQVFDLVYVMTRIDQTNQLPTVVYYIYEEGFRSFRMGYAITVAWALLFIILVFTLLQFRLQRRWVHYG